MKKSSKVLEGEKLRGGGDEIKGKFQSTKLGSSELQGEGGGKPSLNKYRIRPADPF